MPKSNSRIDPDGRQCAKCGEYKFWAMYRKNRKGTKGRASRCSSCVRKDRDAGVYSASEQACALCLRVIDEHRARNVQSRMCRECSRKERAWGHGAKVHLVIDSTEREWIGGHFLKADFESSLQPEETRVLYDSGGRRVGIFDSDQDDELELAILDSGASVVELEYAHLWPEGTVVEIWGNFKYAGTYEVQYIDGSGRLVQVYGRLPKGDGVFFRPDDQRTPSQRAREDAHEQRASG